MTTEQQKEQGDIVGAYYDTIAEHYDESRFNNSYGQFIDYEERRTLDSIIDSSSDRLRLEMACGTGRLTNYATHALDVSAEMMKYAQQRHPNVSFRQVSATETGFDDAMFDTVYAFHLMMHLTPATIEDIIAEVYRILKPGGRFIFDFPSKKRRRLLHHKQPSWHGGTEMSTEDITQLIAQRFHLERTFGVMMLPVHKLPVGIRKPLQRFDYALANGWMKEYSSYLIVELIKEP